MATSLGAGTQELGLREPHGLAGIAIIGLAGRFPQAADVEAFWALLNNGRDAVQRFSDEELLAAGVDPARWPTPITSKPVWWYRALSLSTRRSLT